MGEIVQPAYIWSEGCGQYAFDGWEVGDTWSKQIWHKEVNIKDCKF